MLVGGMQADTNMETSNYTKFDQDIQQLIHAQLGVRAKVYGRLMFKHAERGLHTKSTAELIGTEYKSYPGGVGVGAVKVVDSQKVLSRPDLVEGLQAKADQEGLLICMFMITPLDKPNSAFLVTNKYADLVCSALGDKAAMLDAEKIIELFFASRKGGLVGALPRIVDLIRKAQSSGEEGEV